MQGLGHSHLIENTNIEMGNEIILYQVELLTVHFEHCSTELPGTAAAVPGHAG